MKKSTLKKLKRIIIFSIILIGLIYLIAGPISSAAELPKKGEFYYAGTSKGSFVATENIFRWLFNILAEIIQFIFQLILFIIRMIFVGWAALISEALTGTFNSITGVKYDPSDVDASNINVINVQDNITVEAIVFNKIPIFDVDFFNFDEMEPVSYTDADRTNPGVKIKTPSGKDLADLRCTTCKRVESIGAHTFEHDVELGICTCDVEKCTCKACETRRNCLEPHDDFNPMQIIKQNIAEWYYTIRLMALVGMLLALGAIGIKMAISTVASDKAQYKQMLTSWVVGIILLFGIHYYMVLMINLNNILIDVVVTYAQESSRDIAEQTVSDFGVSSSESDMEINLYEQARTRAYDPNLLNGLTGTILYCTLVYFSVRFAIVYFKRYFTVMILVLMAPGVALTYAIQKAFTGRSHTLSLWLQEFCVNVIIQSVHAIIYAAFLTTALRIAFDSLPGSILAFIIMNFMLKALPIFRKIFKMSSDGGLLDDAMKAGSPERLKEMRDTAVGAALAAKPLAKTFAKLPGTKAVAGLAKSPLTIGSAIKQSKQKKQFKEETDEKVDQAKLDLKDIFAKNKETYGEGTDEELEATANDTTKEQSARDKANDQLRRRRDAIISRAFYGTALNKMATDNSEETDESTEESEDTTKVSPQAEADAMVSAVGMQGASEEQIMAAAQQQFLKDKGIETEVKPESIVSMGWKNYKKNRAMMTDFRNKYDVLLDKDMHVQFKKKHVPKKQYNERTGKYEETSAHKKMRDLSSFRMALGASPEEMKALKTFIRDTSVGALSFFTCMAGMGTVVAHPKIGLALLATGSQYLKLYAPNRTIRGVNKKRLNKTYAFYDYSPGATLAMGKIGSVEARIITKEFEKFVEKHKSETIGAIDSGLNLGAISPELYNYTGEGQEEIQSYLATKLSDLSPEQQMELFFKTDFAKTLTGTERDEAAAAAKEEFSKMIKEEYGGNVQDFLKAVNQAEKPDELPGTLQFADKHFGKMAQGLDAIFEAEAKTAKQAQDAFVTDAILIANMQTASEFRKKLEEIKEQERNRYEEEEIPVDFGEQQSEADKEASEELKKLFGISVAVGDEEIVMDETTIDETKIIRQTVLSKLGTRDEINKLIQTNDVASVKGKAVSEIKARMKNLGLGEDNPEVKRFYQELNQRVEQEINKIVEQAKAPATPAPDTGTESEGKKPVEPLLTKVPEDFSYDSFEEKRRSTPEGDTKPTVKITEFEKKQLKDSLSETVKAEVKKNSKKTFGEAISDEEVKTKIVEEYVKKTRGKDVKLENLPQAEQDFAKAQVEQFLTDVTEKTRASKVQTVSAPTEVLVDTSTGPSMETGTGAPSEGTSPIQAKAAPVNITVRMKTKKKEAEVEEKMKKLSKGFEEVAKINPEETEKKKAAEESLLSIFRDAEETEDPAAVRNQTQLALEAMILNSQLQKLNLSQARYESERQLEPISIKRDKMSTTKKQKAKKAISFLDKISREEDESKKDSMRASVTEEEMQENESLYDEARLGYTSDIIGMINASLGSSNNNS